MSNALISGVLVDAEQSLTLEEFCHATSAKQEVVLQMVAYQLIQPMGKSPEQWRFNSESLRRGRIAYSFYHELEINMPGVALALQLLERVEELERLLGNKFA